MDNGKQSNPEFYRRKSLRLKEFNYANPGAYYVTICAYRQKCIFGKIKNEACNKSDIGEIVVKEWEKLPLRFQNIRLDAFVVMPNHLHGVLWIMDPETENRQNQIASAEDKLVRLPTLGKIIGAYKSLVVHECLKRYKEQNAEMGKIWQQNYYEHIIRNEEDYLRIIEYIQNNPLKWELDRLYTGE